MKIRKEVNRKQDFADHQHLKKLCGLSKTPCPPQYMANKMFRPHKKLPLFLSYIFNESSLTKIVRCFVLFNSDSKIYFV